MLQMVDWTWMFDNLRQWTLLSEHFFKKHLFCSIQIHYKFFNLFLVTDESDKRDSKWALGWILQFLRFFILRCWNGGTLSYKCKRYLSYTAVQSQWLVHTFNSRIYRRYRYDVMLFVYWENGQILNFRRRFIDT